MRHLFFTLIALCVSFSSFALGPILGTPVICQGSTTSLSNTTGGGTWVSSASVVATVDGSGNVTGVTAGTSTISYTVAATIVTQVVTVNPSPLSIAGLYTVCAGSTDVLSDAVAGGTWSSTATGVATVGVTTGIVTGISAGATTISYILATGCFASTTIYVSATPSSIGGSTSVCIGSTTVLSDAAAGGIWSSANAAIATIGTASGIVTGVSVGTSNITYSMPTGCFATTVVTVVPAPSPISGASSMCIGGTDTLTGSPTGGAWSATPSTVVSILSTGVLYGVSAGTATVTYTTSSGCYATFLVTVTSGVSAISGGTTICVGGTTSLTDATAGGVWSSSATSVATISSGGVATGVAAGSTTIMYTLSTGCLASTVLTVNPSPAPITGPGSVCVGSTITLMDAIAGGVWSSGTPSIATIGSAAGVLTGIAPGPATISYQIATGCSAYIIISVNPLPTITATSTANCGGTYSLNASGAGTGGTYLWSPSTGLSCATCATSIATISSTTIYTVAGTDVNGCVNTGTVTLNGNRISGYISLTTVPTDTVKVWLIQFNVTDSSLIAQDSTLSCMDSGTPYYEFDSKPTGSYMVKAKLLSSVPGTSGYIPTYGLSSSVWDSAATITHASATDTQHINMLYGTVPSGPGFIGGLISSGAGRGTSGAVPAVGMLVYLKNAAGNILTYTYTDGTGAYSFSGIANGTYSIYPMDYHYSTTPWTTITLTSASETFNTASFYEHTTLRTITPIGTTGISTPTLKNSFTIYPNPVINELNINWTDEKTEDATIKITDVTGREVSSSILNINATSGNAQLDTHNLNNGIYFITIKSSSVLYTNKLLIKR